MGGRDCAGDAAAADSSSGAFILLRIPLAAPTAALVLPSSGSESVECLVRFVAVLVAGNFFHREAAPHAERDPSAAAGVVNSADLSHGGPVGGKLLRQRREGGRHWWRRRGRWAAVCEDGLRATAGGRGGACVAVAGVGASCVAVRRASATAVIEPHASGRERRADSSRCSCGEG